MFRYVYVATDIAMLMENKTVLLVYSSDNNTHRKVVQQFAIFLQQHCQCDVMYDAWYLTAIHSLSPFEWLMQQISRVDDIVIIHSEGGFRQYEAWKNKESYEMVEHQTPLNDMFIPSILEFMDYYIKGKEKNFYNVVFPYSSMDHIVNIRFGQKYQMMSHLDELFLHIHGLTKFSRNGTTKVPMINAEEYMKCLVGKQLQQALNEASNFVKADANWFDRLFQKKNENKVATNSIESSTSCSDSYVFKKTIRLDEPNKANDGFEVAVFPEKSNSKLVGISPDEEIRINELHFIPPDEEDDGTESMNTMMFVMTAKKLNTEFDVYCNF